MPVRLARMLLVILVAQVAALPLCATAAPGRRTSHWDWNTRLRPGTVVRLLGVQGDVRVEPATGLRARARATISGRLTDPGEVSLRVEHHGDTVTLCTVLPGRGSACEPAASLAQGVVGDAEVDVRLALPVGSPLVVRTLYGNVDVRGVSGRVVVATDHGSVRVETARGGEVTTLNGNIEVRPARLLEGAHLVVRSTNGAIAVHAPADLDGEVRAASLNAQVREHGRPRSAGAPVRQQAWRFGAPRGSIDCLSENGDVVLHRGR